MGQVLALGGLPSFKPGFLAFVCVFCLSASVLIFNDYFDYEVDRINAPSRPLPSGKVTRADVIGLAVATGLVGLACALAISLPALLVGILLWVIGFLYNWRYKQAGLPGNLMVSLSVASTFIFGALSVQALGSGVVWAFSGMAFFFDLGEEIAGDAMDMEGDKKRGSRSLARLRGRYFALRICVALWSLFIILSLLPLIIGWLGMSYFVIIGITDALLVYFSIRLLQSKDSDAGHRAMRGAYLTASLCVVAFVVGRFVS